MFGNRPNFLERHPWIAAALLALCYLVSSYEPPGGDAARIYVQQTGE